MAAVSYVHPNVGSADEWSVPGDLVPAGLTQSIDTEADGVFRVPEVASSFDVSAVASSFEVPEVRATFTVPGV